MISEIRGAVARGWCSPGNSHKEMDSTLAEAISQEMLKLFDAKFTSDNSDYVSAVKKLIDSNVDCVETVNGKYIEYDGVIDCLNLASQDFS